MRFTYGLLTGLLIASVPAALAATVFFRDVPAGAWYAAAVERLSDRGIFQASEDGRFRPQHNVTRAELAVVIDRTIAALEGRVVARPLPAPAGPARPAIIRRTSSLSSRSATTQANRPPPSTAPAGQPVFLGGGCTPTDLTVTSQSRVTTAGIEGSFVFKNQSSAACRLQGYPLARLVDAVGTAFTVSSRRMGDASAITVEPGRSTTVRFAWSNWCGSAPRNPFTAILEFSGEEEFLLTPLLHDDGDVIRSTPACTDSSRSSELLLHPFGS